MKQSEIARKQFNQQAQAFSHWTVTRNTGYMQAIAEFLGLSPDDTLLDVACGTGEFALYVSPRVKEVVGMDVSEAMIEIALRQKRGLNVANAKFRTGEVSRLPYPDGQFSVVFSKSAFHHFAEAGKVFREMARCCQTGGKVGVCDILAFEDKAVDAYFEVFEKAVDRSHYRTLSKAGILRLYKDNHIPVDKMQEVEIELSLSEYLGHAVQSGESRKRIEKLVKQAQTDDRLKEHWTFGNGWERAKFRRKVILTLGGK